MDTALAELLQLTRYAGRSPEFVQGAGGNVSVKDPGDDRMYIKASGVKLSEVTDTSGYVTLSLKDHSPIDHQSTVRPSVETPMHFLLGRCVLHTHAIAAGIIVCDVLGKEKVKTLFANDTTFDCLYLDDYVAPGEKLEQAIQELLNKKKTNATTLVLFLQNHGVVISAADAETAIRTHDTVIQTIIARYPLIDTGTPAPEHVLLTSEQGLCGTDTDHATFTRIVYATVQKYGMLSLIEPEAIAALKERSDMQYRLEQRHRTS